MRIQLRSAYLLPEKREASPEIGDLKVNVDSSITLKFEGQPLTLKPEFEVVPGATSSDSI
jgi:hypothetical protein